MHTFAKEGNHFIKSNKLFPIMSSSWDNIEDIFCTQNDERPRCSSPVLGCYKK